MKILGVDPGLKHTGWAILNDGKASVVGTIVPAVKGKLTTPIVLAVVLPALLEVIEEHAPLWAAVEEVQWYGRGRSITMPLSHVAGAIVGFLLGRGIPVFLLSAAMKTARIRGKRDWDDHQRDAAKLARVAWQWVDAAKHDDIAYAKKHSRVGARLIHNVS